MVKVYHLNNPRLTVWETHFEQAKTKRDAEIWVANQEQILRDAIEEAITNNQKKPKTLFLWTSEPYYSTTRNQTSTLYGIPVHIFNLWNRRAFFHNGIFLYQAYPTALSPRPSLRTQWRSMGPQICCALITYPQGNRVEFTQERVAVAKTGHSKKLCDIYGKGWPPGYSRENSRDGEWWKSKPGILQNYDFCLAMENCLQPYYVSEKLWDSILNGCVPIYCDNGTIYNDFPRGSFLDIREFASLDELWTKVKTMSLYEWNQRFDLCWNAMETVWKRGHGIDYWKESAEEIQKTLDVLKFV
jgi:hypothetical protein